MQSWSRRRIPLPLAGWSLAVLGAAFLLPGIFGHDPWKTEDAVAFGVVWQMLESGNWLTLGLAGDPYLEDGPLFYWLAAAFAKAFAGVLAPHDAARIPSVLFMVAAFWFVRLAARELYGKVQGDLSMLAFLGCLGLAWHAHETAAETAMLAGLAAAYYGLAISHKKPYKSALVFGCGTGIAFLSKGLIAGLQPLAAALLMLPLSASLQARNYVIAVTLGLVVLAPLAIAWPVAFALQAPQYFEGWLAWQFASISDPPTWDKLLGYLKIFAWAAWPVWPLTLWATWEYRRYLRDPGFAVPSVGAAVCLVLLLFARPVAEEMDALALLVPLSIPAGAAALGLRRGAANALAWFSVMTFTIAVGFAWVMWFASVTGFPPPLAQNVAKLAPGFVGEFRWLPYVFASLLTIAWFVLVARSERSTLRSLTHWAAGLTVTWGLTMTLGLDWIDYGKTYRGVATSLREQLPADLDCLESRGLGETQRAVFHYHGGVITQRAEVHGVTGCHWLLVQAPAVRRPADDPGTQWTEVWEGRRPRDAERYRLYVRN